MANTNSKYESFVEHHRLLRTMANWWTPTHGFFALIGGFTVLDEDGRQHPFSLQLTARTIQCLPDMGTGGPDLQRTRKTRMNRGRTSTT